MKLNEKLKDILDVRNNIFLVIMIFMLAVGLLIGVSVSLGVQINNKLDTVLDYTKILSDLTTQPKQQQQETVDEFSLLSDDAIQYYDRLGEQVKGTPTWIINGKKYIGFDVQNNKVPGFTGEFKDDTILFSSPTCSYCIKAEEYLKLINVDYVKVCVPIHKGDYALCDDSFIK